MLRQTKPMRKNWNRQEQKNNMNRLAKWWQSFDGKHPIAARWIREGGLFVIVSNLITVFKYVLLQFLPRAFAGLPVVDFGWPGIPVTLFGETFKWNILGYGFSQQRQSGKTDRSLFSGILYHHLHCKFYQLCMGGHSRNIRTGFYLQYRNYSVKRRSIHGDFLLCKQSNFSFGRK